MSKRFTIKETDVYGLILKELNTNSFGVKFSYSNWGFTDDKQNNFLFIKYALNDERFDEVKTFDDETYASSVESFVAVGIPSLNGEPIALKEIKEFTYNTIINFIVSAENIVASVVIMNAIEEVRARLIQYQTSFESSFFDLDNKNSKQKITERYEVIIQSGSIDRSETTTINGKKYIEVSMPIFMLATDSGLFGNQNIIKLGCDKVLNENDVIIMHEIPFIEWSWGRADDIESAQMLADKDLTLQGNSFEVKSIHKASANSYTLTFQMDLKNPLLRYLYIKSKKPSGVREVFTLVDETLEYNEATKTYEIAPDLTVTRKMICNTVQPIEGVSKGEKIMFTMTLLPYLEEIQ